MSEPSYVELRGGRRIAFQEYGDREGHPVFFFHGWIETAWWGDRVPEKRKAPTFPVGALVESSA